MSFLDDIFSKIGGGLKSAAPTLGDVGQEIAWSLPAALGAGLATRRSPGSVALGTMLGNVSQAEEGRIAEEHGMRPLRQAAQSMYQMQPQGWLPQQNQQNFQNIMQQDPQLAVQYMQKAEAEREREKLAQNKTRTPIPLYDVHSPTGQIKAWVQPGEMPPSPDLVPYGPWLHQQQQQKIDEVNTPFKAFAANQQLNNVPKDQWWPNYQREQNNLATNKAASVRLAQLQTTKQFAGVQPAATALQLIPGMKGKIILDTKTLLPDYKVTLNDTWNNPTRYATLDTTQARDLANLRPVRTTIDEMAAVTGQANLPRDKGSLLSNFVTNLGERWRPAVGLRTYNQAVNLFQANRTQLAMELQKVLTGSTRPTNLVEFNRIVGKPDNASWTGVLSPNESSALVPDIHTDTVEIAQRKLHVLDELFRNKVAAMTGTLPDPSTAVQQLNTAVPPDGADRTSAGPEDWKNSAEGF